MKKSKIKQIKFISASFGILIGVSVITFLVYKYWSPLGKKLILNFKSKGSEISLAKVSEHDGNLSIPAQVIKSPTIRFNMDLKSTDIESIVAKLKFKTGPKEIKLGIRGSEKDKFIYQSFYQKLLQDCSWDTIGESGKTLYQKTKNYDDIRQLIEDPPDYRQIASYAINPSMFIQNLLDDKLTPKKEAKNIEIKTGLRGSHTFVVRVDRAPFYFKLTKQDINMYAGEDKFLLSITLNGQLIEEKSIADDGFVGTEKLKKDPRSVEFNLTDIKPGIYEISAKDESKGSDSVITQIVTNQSKVVIKNDVFTLNDKAITLYTATSPITLTVVHKDYLQTVKLDNTIPLDLKKEGQKYVFDLEKLVKNKKADELYKLETPKTDLSFNSTGYFAFAPEQYFDPEVIHTTDLNTVASIEEIDYLLTTVPKATQEGEWLTSEIKFNSQDIKLGENKKLYFSLEMPDLAKYSGELEMAYFTVEVKLKGDLSDTFNQQKITPTLIPTIAPSPTLPPNPSPKPTDTVSSLGLNMSTNIIVVNAGAPASFTQKYINLFKSASYQSVSAGAVTYEKLKNATLVLPDNTSITDILTLQDILKKEYKIVNQITNYHNSDIIVKLGAL